MQKPCVCRRMDQEIMSDHVIFAHMHHPIANLPIQHLRRPRPVPKNQNDSRPLKSSIFHFFPNVFVFFKEF